MFLLSQAAPGASHAGLTGQLKQAPLTESRALHSLLQCCQQSGTLLTSLSGLQVGMECSKYGGVQSVLIFEVLEPGFNPEEAVRIFVRFGRIEDATKALVDLGGRFFGGRTVSACFFDEDKFNRQDLAPKPNE